MTNDTSSRARNRFPLIGLRRMTAMSASLNERVERLRNSFFVTCSTMMEGLVAAMVITGPGQRAFEATEHPLADDECGDRQGDGDERVDPEVRREADVALGLADRQRLACGDLRIHDALDRGAPDRPVEHPTHTASGFDAHTKKSPSWILP